MALQLLMLFKKSRMSLIANQTKYGYIKAVSFIIDQWMKPWLGKIAIEIYSIHN